MSFCLNSSDALPWQSGQLASSPCPPLPETAEQIFVSGTVQGVGLRPTIHRIASELGLRGSVRHQEQGLLITVRGSRLGLALLVARLLGECPALAKITCIKRRPTDPAAVSEPGFYLISPGPAPESVDPESGIGQPGRVFCCPYCRADILATIGPDL